MKNGLIFFLGLLAAVTISWAAVVLGSHAQLGSLAPYFDDTQSQAFPNRQTGLAARGQLVYADLGCAACHTQQVRRAGYGSDKDRGFGERQSVARDYIFESRPQLGASRVGPDLANFGARAAANADATAAIHALLYQGSASHPAYPFLYDNQAIAGEKSAKALALSGAAAPAAGFQVVPSERAQTLAAYLLNLNQGYDFPEARPYTPPAKKGEAKK